MFRYRFIHEFGTVFNHLQHGEHVKVTPADGRELPADSTVELHPGDVIETTEPLDHPYLEPDNAEAKKATATVPTPAPEPEAVTEPAATQE